MRAVVVVVAVVMVAVMGDRSRVRLVVSRGGTTTVVVIVVGIVSVLVLLLPSLDVGTLVDSNVPRQLVAPREPLVAPSVVTGVRLLSGVGSDVTGLMLESIEGSVAERALVRSRDLALVHAQSSFRESFDGWIVGIEPSGDGIRNGSWVVHIVEERGHD